MLYSGQLEIRLSVEIQIPFYRIGGHLIQCAYILVISSTKYTCYLEKEMNSINYDVYLVLTSVRLRYVWKHTVSYPVLTNTIKLHISN